MSHRQCDCFPSVPSEHDCLVVVRWLWVFFIAVIVFGGICLWHTDKVKRQEIATMQNTNTAVSSEVRR